MAAKKNEKPNDEIEQYIRIEVSDRQHIIASRQIGSKEAFLQIATTRNRSMAERMVAMLNNVDARRPA